jgi:hypothetical protein
MKTNNKNYKVTDFLFVLLVWLTVISFVYILIIKLQ